MEGIILAAILLIGLLMRWSYLSEIVHAPDFESPAADAAFHDYWARALTSGDWATPEGQQQPKIPDVPYLRPPGYPYFLAAAYMLTGKSYVGARIIQVALGLVNCVLAFLLGRSLFGRAVGLIVAGFCTGYWALIYFEGELQAPTIIITLSLWLMLFLRRWAIRPTLLRAAGGGVLIGLLALVRANTLLFIPVAAAWVWWAARRQKPGIRPPLHAAALLVGSVVAISPATVRNYLVADDFVLVSCNGAVNLYIGNNETSDGITAKIPDLFELTGLEGWSWFAYDRIAQGVSQHEGRKMKYSEVSSFFTRRAIDYIENNPSRFIVLCLRRAALFWGPAEISNNKAISVEKANSRTLRWIPGFPFVLSLAMLGAVMLLVEQRARHRGGGGPGLASPHHGALLVLIGLFIATYFASFIPFLAAGRFRVPLLPFLFLFGACGLYRFAQLIAGRAWPRMTGTLITWGALFLICSRPLVAYRPVDVAWWHTDRAEALVAQGRLDEAVQEFQLALQSKPNVVFVDAQLGLAETLAELGRIDEAISRVENVLAHRPDRADVRMRLASLLSEQGKLLLEKQRYAEAADVFRRSLQFAADSPDNHTNLGIALAGVGQHDAAIEQYRQAIDLQPDHAEAYYNLGNSLREKGASDEASAAFRQAIGIKPDHVEAIINLGVALAEQRRHDEAIERYREAIDIDQRNMIARCNLAGALANLGRIDEAIRELEAALRIDPQHSVARQRLEALRSFEQQRRRGPP